MQLPPVPAGADPWDHFATQLRNRFESQNNAMFTRQKLYSLKQTGSVTKYISQFEDLKLRLDDFGEAEALNCFLMGLKPKLQEHFAGNPTLRTNLFTVQQIAESLDNKQHSFRFNQYQPRQESFPQPMDLDAMEKTSQPPTVDRQKQKQSDLKNRACFKCHVPGHQIRDCPKNSNSGKATSH
ncbi:hypothetical protein BGX29_005305 [Mortierella sp. GBA35]|nr:hypothetical protein BGX29_005305 [Mortierella sp. GBA35]